MSPVVGMFTAVQILRHFQSDCRLDSRMIFYANPFPHCHPSTRSEPVIVLKPLVRAGGPAVRQCNRKQIPRAANRTMALAMSSWRHLLVGNDPRCGNQGFTCLTLLLRADSCSPPAMALYAHPLSAAPPALSFVAAAYPALPGLG